jgi:N-acetylmuramoyl-L-alanine amidase CwlA
MYQLCKTHGLRAEVLIVQSIHETSVDGVPWSSYWYTERMNVAGIGITGDPTQDNASRDFQNGENAARAHFLHAYLYAVGTDIPTGLSRQDDTRYDAALAADYAGIAPTIREFSGRWGVDRFYSNSWLNRLNELEPVIDRTVTKSEPVETGEPAMAGMKKYRFAGLDADVWLPDDINVQTKIITSSRFRSYTKDTSQIYTVFHSTGNPNTNATDEWTWANNGRPGGSVGGYDFIVDDKTIINCKPLNEVTWAQGVAWGNVEGWATEFAYGGKVNYEKALRNVTALHGALCAAKGWDVDKALKPHRFFTGKYCPSIIYDKGDWDRVVTMVKQAYANARSAMTGSAIGGVVDAPKYPAPKPMPEFEQYKDADRNLIPSVITLSDGTKAFYVGDVVEAIRQTPRLQLAYQGAPELNVPIDKGEQFSVEWLFTADDGDLYFYTRWATRVRVDDTKRVADVIPEAA